MLPFGFLSSSSLTVFQQSRWCRSRTGHTVCRKEYQPPVHVGSCSVFDGKQQFWLSLSGQRSAPYYCSRPTVGDVSRPTDFIHHSISPVRIAVISMMFLWSRAIPASFMCKLVAMPPFSGALPCFISCILPSFLVFFDSLGAVNQVLRHRDFDVKTFPSSRRSCRYSAGLLACKLA